MSPRALEGTGKALGWSSLELFWLKHCPPTLRCLSLEGEVRRKMSGELHLDPQLPSFWPPALPCLSCAHRWALASWPRESAL